MSDIPSKPDVAIIGGGPGGYTAAIRLGQLNQEVVVIEREAIGGVCLNWGCIPTKALYSVTEPLAKHKSWTKRGIEVGEPEIDLGKLRQSQNGVVDSLTSGVEKLIEANGGVVVEGEGTLHPGPEVKVVTGDGSELTINPDSTILATGSEPIAIPSFDFDNSWVWDSREALSLQHIPDDLLILGAGVIGLEMGTIFSRLGSEVRIIEMEDQILPGLDIGRKIRSLLSRRLKQQGIKIPTGTKATNFAIEGGDPLVTAKDRQEGEMKEFWCDQVLMAVGRRPIKGACEELDLEEDDSGFLVVDQRMQTSREGIYAIGDLVGPPLLAHKASKEALVVAEAIAGGKDLAVGPIPSAIFTDPELAFVGTSRQTAREKGIEVQSGSFPMRASGKAIAMDETDGMVNIVAHADTGRILGGQIFSPHASDMISEITLAIHNELTVDDIADTIHPHPTLSEAVLEAAEHSEGRAINTLNR